MGFGDLINPGRVVDAKKLPRLGSQLPPPTSPLHAQGSVVPSSSAAGAALMRRMCVWGPPLRGRGPR
eukprot:gene28770-33366_t